MYSNRCKKNAFALALCMVLLCLSSCATLDALSCPYIIANPHVEIGEKADSHTYVGAYMGIYNDSEKTISTYTVSFMLYEQDGTIPFVGTNCVVANCVREILPKTEDECIINLDSFISVVPDEPYKIDFLYLREITYTDGSSWSDPFGMYALQEAEE